MSNKKVRTRGDLIRLVKDLTDKTGRTPFMADFLARGRVKEREIRNHFGSYTRFLEAAKLPQPQDSRNAEATDTLIKGYLDILDRKKMRPTTGDMIAKGHSPDQIQRIFGGMDKLKKEVKKLHPEAFDSIVDDDIFTPKALQNLKLEAAKYKRFVITTAVEGCPVDKNFLQSIDAYCQAKEALLLILIAADPAADAGFALDTILKDRYIVFDDVALNKNLFISTIKLSAKHIDPITGLGRIGQRNGSFIYASPKQRLKMVPTSNQKHPVAIMTTGAVTKPNYETSRYMSDRTATIADNDHVMGALIVEIEDKRHFHFRQVQADKFGGFIDLGEFFDRDDYYKMDADSIKMGDLHSGETDPVAKKCTFEMIEALNPKRIFVDDGFSGVSINHHERKNRVYQAQQANKSLLSLEKEIVNFAKDVDELCEKADEVVIVDSNHHDFLIKYLDEFMFREDPQNITYSLELALAMSKGANPLQYGVEKAGLKYPDKVRWLSRDEDFKVAGIELGAHGDLGANGARGNLRAMEEAYGNSVSGHAHTPEILRGAWQVGTLSLLKLNYNSGPSSWCHTNCIVYPNGARQLLSIVSGKWRLE